MGPGMEFKGRAIGLREPQGGSLIPPIEGQTGVGHQLVGGEAGRLLPCKDRGDNIRGEKSTENWYVDQGSILRARCLKPSSRGLRPLCPGRGRGRDFLSIAATNAAEPNGRPISSALDAG